MNSESIYKKLDPPVRKELKRLKRLASKSVTNLRQFEAYQDLSFEPYIINPNSHMYFALSKKQWQILNEKVEKLNLREATKELIHERTAEFFKDFRYEYHDRINFKKTDIQNKGINDLRESFELEIDNILSRYRKEYYTTDFAYELAQFQTQIVKLFHENFDDDPLELLLKKEIAKGEPKEKDWEQELIERYAPSNRPSYKCYAPYLYDLSIFIQKEKNNYMPILVDFLTSFQATAFDIFDSFVINKSSVRSLISKHRRDMNKGVKD